MHGVKPAKGGEGKKQSQGRDKGRAGPIYIQRAGVKSKDNGKKKCTER